MLTNFRDKWLPVYQMPDAPTSPAPSSDSGASSSASAPSTASPSSSTPSTPSSSPTTEPSGDGAASSFEFMFDSTGGDPLNGPSDTGLSPPTVASPSPTPAQTAPAPAAVPAATTPEPGTPPTTATPAPTEAASPTQTEGGSQPNLDPYDPGTLAAHLAQNEEQVVQHVADNLFKLSDKDVEELESNAVAAIPKLLARSFVSAQKNFLMQLANLVPRMIQSHGEVTKRHSEAEGEFYSRWPDLKKDQEITVAGKPTTVNKLVMSYASVYRQMNPQASRKDAIEYVGPMVMMAAGVTPSAQGHVQNAPAASPMTNGVRPPQPTPFSPAGPLAGGAVPTTGPELDPVSSLFIGPQTQ